MSEITKRPTTLTPDRANAAAAKIADELIEWHEMPAADRDGIIADIVKCARPHLDGYQIAKELDRRCHWDCNMGIAEVLDTWSGTASDQMQEQEAEWVAANNIQPSLAIGTKIILSTGETGTLSGVYEHGVARYLVRMDHEVSDTTKRIVLFEDAKVLEAVA